MDKHLTQLQKQPSHNGEDHEFDKRYLAEESTPENVMYRMQGPLRLDKPLKADGTSDTGKQSC